MSNGTQLFDLPNWTVISISGPDRKSYLHSFCTNDIQKLAERETCEAFIPNEKGRILGHIFVFNGKEELTLISTPDANEILFPHLKKYLLGVEAEVLDRTADLSGFAIIGDRAYSTLNSNEEIERQSSTLILPISMTKHPTYLVFDEQESIKSFKEKLLDNEVRLGTGEQLETLRIEAGFPYVGIDLSAANIVQESARVKLTTSFTKGCYLGQEPIARLDAMGHTNKELRGFLIDSDRVSPGSKILADEIEIGEISSATEINNGQSLGLGVIRIKYADPESKVTVVTESGSFPAKVYWDHQ